MAFLGCAYRRRTGACTCDNPPIGCKQDVPAAAQGGARGAPSAPAQPYRIHFPAGVSSYRELREGPTGRVAGGGATSPAAADPLPARPVREVAPAPPRPLPTALGPLPAVGWRCSAADAAAAAASGMKLLCADGDAAAEAALGSIDTAGLVLCTSVDGMSADGVAAAVNAAAGRMRVDMLLLRWTGDGDAPGLEQAFAAAASCAAAAHVQHLGLQCDSAEVAQRCMARLLAAGPRPALLALPLHPATPRQRALVGLCRRSGVRVAALSPCGAAALAATPELAAAAATRAGCAPAEAGADALLAWCIGREVVALASAADATQSHVARVAAGGAMDLEAAHRSAIDAAGDRLSAAA